MIIFIWHLFWKTQFYFKSSSNFKSSWSWQSIWTISKGRSKTFTETYYDSCYLSITSNRFPNILNVAILKPLDKKGFLNESCSCRSLFLLPLIFKVIGKVIHDQTSTFLNSKNLLYTYQFNFQKKDSTNFCLSYLYDKILCFDKRSDGWHDSYWTS